MANVNLVWHAEDEQGTPYSPHPISRIEPRRIKSFLNSDTPATQAISGLSGDHICFFEEGAGSITLSGGATGVVTAGNPVVFDPVGASVTFTVAGTVERPSVEGGRIPTSYASVGATPVMTDRDRVVFDTEGLNAFKGPVECKFAASWSHDALSAGIESTSLILRASASQYLLYFMRDVAGDGYVCADYTNTSAIKSRVQVPLNWVSGMRYAALLNYDAATAAISLSVDGGAPAAANDFAEIAIDLGHVEANGDYVAGPTNVFDVGIG